MKEEKQQIADIDRSVYDIKDREDDFYKIDAGLTPALVEQISKEKNDPEWMKEFRRLAHGSDCHLCASEHQDEGRLVGSTGGHQEHL